MTLFDAANPTERRRLCVAGITAHRERASEFCTLEADSTPPHSDDDLVPWIQIGGTTLSLDCTDAELDRLKTLVDDYPDFRIDELISPEEADGTHARISSRSDAPRLAGFCDEVFQSVFGYDDAYRLWVAAI